jgi:hypothetical protein
MLKISLTELEDARKNPVAFRAKHEDKKRDGGNSSIYSTLRNTIFAFHKTSNFSSAMNYLESHLEKFPNQENCQKAVEQFQWYVTEYQKLGWPFVQTRLNIVVPLSTQYADSLKLSGQISRLDINLEGGYAAWLLRKKGSKDWINELQMPIIQNAIGVHLSKLEKPRILVGIISFEERYIRVHEFTESEIAQAHVDLETMFKQMGY